MDAALFALLLCVSSFFSGSETALFSIGKVTRVRLAGSVRAADKRITRLLQQPRDLLIAVLLGNELTNVGLSIVSASIISRVFVDYGLVAQAILSAAVVVPLLLLFGEITPRRSPPSSRRPWHASSLAP